MKRLYTKYFITILSLLALVITGCQSGRHSDTVTRDSSGSLGTQWGDGIESHVQQVSMKRTSFNPIDVITINYSGHQYKGKTILEVMLNNGRIGMAFLDDRDNKWPLTKQNNKVKLQGLVGQSYQLFYRNYSANTYEIIATVDGLDVINGKAGSLSNDGYILRPYDILVIKGFRKSNNEVAAFTFSDSSNAYANHTDEGSVGNVGVIGTAVFQLVDNNKNYQKVSPNAFPADKADDTYAKPPVY
ncbi:hypothetical protein [Gilliamella sp. wkB112]|uniref:hypothetical protein n=1 Tax=Gilliamella sp. wkB112 TaxID=3120257 RepID=UPI00080DC813|nr:hypothetical protein [Gilliamella apicola]OCG02827.1 hypothetical protein A9G12_07770 [Gilliamella apicola]